MRLFSITGAVLISNLVTLITTASIELTPDNIKDKIQSGTWLIEHFSPYCPHCVNFAPEWTKLSHDLDHLAETSDFHFGTIDCTTQGDLCDEHGIDRYPTLQLWQQGEKIETYFGLNKYDPLTEYIMNKVNTEEIEKELETEEEVDETEAEAEAEKEQEEEEEIEIPEEEELAAEEDAQELAAEEDAQELAAEEDAQELAAEEDATEEDAQELAAQEDATEEEEEGLGLEVFDDLIEEEEEVSEEMMDSHTTPNPNGVSLNLEGKQMREITSGRTPWFIKFYAPWCPHCQRLAPTWKEMASELRSQVNVGEVNCDAVPSVCQELNIRGYPTLQIHGGGRPVQYAGDRTLPSLLKFARSHAGPAIREVQVNEFDEKLATEETVLLYLHNDQQTDMPEILNTIADEYASSMTVVSSQDTELLTRFDLSTFDLPVLVMSKDNKYHVYPSRDFSDRTEVINWIESQQHPLVVELNPANYESVLQGQSTVVLNIVNGQDTLSQTKFRNIATVWQTIKPKSSDNHAVFAEMDRALWKDYVFEKFHINHDDTSKIVIYEPTTSSFVSKDAHGRHLSLDKPEDLYIELKNREDTVVYEATRSSFSISSWTHTHWFISLLGLTAIGSYVYRAINRPQANVLPTYYSNKTKK